MSVTTDTETNTEKKIAPPSLWQVILHNDDFTPMRFVVSILMEIFHKSKEDAETITWDIHKKGRGICGIYTKEIALTKSNLVLKTANSAGHPLLATIEKAPT